MLFDPFPIRRPDDWHVHLRQALLLALVIRFANLSGRVVVEPM